LLLAVHLNVLMDAQGEKELAEVQAKLDEMQRQFEAAMAEKQVRASERRCLPA
jgi:hypothetical protein